MAGTRLTFLLDGRDHLSRVLDRAGDAATRLGRRLLIAHINGDMAMRRLGRTTADQMAGLQHDTDAGKKALEGLKKSVVSLAPAAIPMAASLAPIAPAVGAAVVAVAAFGAALGPQISALTEAAEAEKAYTDAVDKGGARSEAAVTAHQDYVRTMADLPPATRRAAAGLSVLKDEYKDWSDSLAGDTMAPVVKSLSVFTALLPKTTGLVKGTSAQLDRMVTIVAGGMESPGLDHLDGKFTHFATHTLSRVNDAVVRLMRTTDTGKIGGGAREFMDYARDAGPAVADTLHNVGQALINVLRGTSGVGVGMLDVVNGLTGIVSAVPPGAIATLLQLAIAIKVVKLGALGLAAGRQAVAAFGTQLVAMRTAAAATTGRMATLSASFGALSKSARLAVVGTGIGLLVIALMSLSNMGKKAPPDVDRLTTSLGQLAKTGKVTGEAARAFGTDLGGLADALRTLSRPSNLDKTQQFLTSLIGMDSTPVKEAKENLSAVDDALAGLVQGGKGKLAAAAFDQLAAGMQKQGMSADELRGKLDGYEAALADQAFEQQLAAQAMGLFGTQAQAVQQKLDAQKASADGLRQSIVALNDVNRQGLGGMIAFEAAIDAAAKAAADNAGALRMTGGELNLNSEKARNAATALNDLASKTDEAATAARQNGASWSEVNGIYDRGRAKLIAAGDAMGLTRAQAKALADQILATPDKTARLRGNVEDLESKLASAKARLKSVPDSRRAAVRAQITDLENKIAAAKRQLAGLSDKTVTIRTNYVSIRKPSDFGIPANLYKADGGIIRRAAGGPVGFPGGGPVRGPGTDTSDSILARVSNNEYVVKAKSVAKYGVAFMDALNEGRLSLSASGSGGGAAGAGRLAAAGLASGMGAGTGQVERAARVMAAAVTAGVRDELEIRSPSKKMQALMKDVGAGLIVGLTGSKDKIKAVAADLVKDIWAAWSGVKTTKDSVLVAMVTRDTAKLQKLATARDAITASITAAKQYQTELTANARSAAGLSSLGIGEEEVSAGTIQAGLSEKLNKINQFARYIASLAKRGLNKNLLQQVLNMGPDQGYAYASALAGMGTAALQAANTTQGHLDKAATTLGGLGADSMYDSGAQAGRGFLAGLASQQKAIEAQMVTIAKGMDKAIRKALGIKSPSTVAATSGGHFTEGLAVGAVKRLPVLDRALATISGRVAATRPVIGRPAVVGGGARGAQPVQIQIDVHGAMDPVAVGRELQRVLLGLKRTQGLNVNLGVG